MIDLSSLALLKGKKALVTGVANDQSIAWGCAKAFHAFGADVAVTYLNDKSKPYVEPLAKEIEASIFMPLDIQRSGELEAVFEKVDQKWGTLDLCLHSIAFARKEDLQGRVVAQSIGSENGLVEWFPEQMQSYRIVVTSRGEIESHVSVATN